MDPEEYEVKFLTAADLARISNMHTAALVAANFLRWLATGRRS